jgi:hypothetical protein
MDELLKRLNSVLGELYDGNTITEPRGGVSHVDQYRCKCGAIVNLDEWSERDKMCVDCHLEKVENANFKWGEL